MPELPEVEYVRRNLERWVRGATIQRVVVDDARIVRPMSARAFSQGVAGRAVVAIERRGKWIRWTLDDDRKVFVHLGMTGWFERDDVADPSNPHPAAGHHLRFERVRFEMRKGPAVVYVDSRRWGRVLLTAEDIPSWRALGPDPLHDGIDLDRLVTKLARRARRSIKEVLLDQAVLAGVGNIQATEALWKAKIDPRSSAAALSRADLARVAAAIRWTIARTLADLTKSAPRRDSPFRIYGHKGEPCSRCKTTLRRIELGGRTTTFCPGCQVRLRKGRRTA